MGSRYDLSVFRGVTLAQFAQAFAGRGEMGAVVAGPWAAGAEATVAQIDTGSASNVVVAAEPMRTPRGIGILLATNLGVEALFATVWDSVSVYSLTVSGPGVDRTLSIEMPESEDDEPQLETSGAPLPEEPSWPDLDEAYIQAVLMGRYGIDLGNLAAPDVTWYSLTTVRGPR